MDLFARQKQTALYAIEDNLKLEKYPLFTLNEQYLSYVREKWLLRYKQARKKEDEYRLSEKESLADYSTVCESINILLCNYCAQVLLTQGSNCQYFSSIEEGSVWKFRDTTT